MNTQLLGTLRLTIIDELRAEIREREGVIADLTRDEERDGPVLAFMPSTGSTELTPRPVHGDAIAKARGSGKLLATEKKRKGKRHRRTPEDVQDTGQDILDYVREFPGQRGEQITTALGMSAKEMRKPMLALIAAKRIGTKGQRRGMTYFPKGRAK